MKHAALALVLCGCLYPKYIAQGAAGQLDLMSRAKPIDEVIRDPHLVDDWSQLAATAWWRPVAAA